MNYSFHGAASNTSVMSGILQANSNEENLTGAERPIKFPVYGCQSVFEREHLTYTIHRPKYFLNIWNKQQT